MFMMLALGAAVPAIGSTAWAAVVLGGGAGWRWRARALTPVVFALIIIGTHTLLFGVRVPRSAMDWLPWIALAAGGVASMPRTCPWSAWAPRVVLALGAAWASSIIPMRGWSPWQAAAHLGGFAGALLGVLAALDRLGDRAGPRTLAAVLTLAAAGVSQVLVLGFYSLKLGQAAGISAALAGGVLLALLVRPRAKAAAGDLLAPVIAAAAALYQGVLYADAAQASWYVPCLAAGPIVAAGTHALIPERVGARRRAALTIAASALPVLAALALALATREADPYA